MQKNIEMCTRRQLDREISDLANATEGKMQPNAVRCKPGHNDHFCAQTWFVIVANIFDFLRPYENNLMAFLKITKIFNFLRPYEKE